MSPFAVLEVGESAVPLESTLRCKLGQRKEAHGKILHTQLWYHLDWKIP